MTQQYQKAALEALSEKLVEAESMRLRVNGGSMRPVLRIGDWIVAEKINPEELKLGDLVVVRREQDVVTHRLVRAEATGWWVKGDWLGSLDPFVETSAIWGRVVQIERSGRMIHLRTPWRRRSASVIALSSWWEAQLLNRLATRRATLDRLLRRMVRIPFRALHWALSL